MNSDWIPRFISLTLLVSLASCGDEQTTIGTSELTADGFRSTQSDGLELHWTFEDRSGSTIYDMSGNGRDGTLSGGSFVSAPWGDAVTLDGVDDKISFTGPRDPVDFGGEETGSFTVSAHIRVDDVDRSNTLCVGCAPLSNLVIGSTNVGPRVVAGLHDPTVPIPYKIFPTSHESLSDATWTHVTMVVEAGVGTTFYLNCEENRFVPQPNVELHDYSYSSVGEGGSSTTWYDGEIDDLKVWSRALSADDIKDLCPCGGAPEAYTLGIDLPTPPSSYTPPTEYIPNPADPATTVNWVDPSGLDSLQAAITAGHKTIVLRNGVYTADDVDGDWLSIDGQKLWAESLGGVTLEFAIDAGGYDDPNFYPGYYSGSELHGLVFDIEDVDNAPQWGVVDPDPDKPRPPGKTAITGWGDSTDFVIEDCIIHGGPLDTGIYIASPEGFEARRLEIDHLNRYGMIIQNTATNPTNPMTITDIRVWDIDDPTHSKSGVGLRVGETANVSHIHVRDIRWAGVAINGESDGSTVSYVDADRIGTTETTGRVGIYLDNVAQNVNVDHFCVGPNTRVGVNSEWDNCQAADKPLCQGSDDFARGIDNVVEYGLSEAWLVGVHFDQGTVRGDVNHVTLRNYTRAGIIQHNNVSTTWPTYDNGSTQSNNTFEETQTNCSICDVTYSVWTDTTPQCVGQGAC